MFSSLTLTGGFSSSASEVVAVLNGAHLNASRYGNWIRRYIISPSIEPEIQPVPSSQAPCRPSMTPSLPSLAVLSELGLSNYTEAEWNRALAATFRVVDTSLARGQHPTSRNVIKHSRNSCHMQSFYRSHQGFHSRSFSSMSHSYRSLSGTSSLRTMWNKEKLVFKRFASVYYLEERANSETDNPVAQAKYLAAVLKEDPEYVVRRFQSGRYAINSDSRHIYQKALAMAAEKPRSGETGVSALDSIFAGKSRAPYSAEHLGSANNPVHTYVIEEETSFGTALKKDLWSFFRFIIALTIIGVAVTFLFSSSVISSIKNTTKQLQINYQPDMNKKKYTFEDIQGVDEAKEEVKEIVEFLKNPEKFQRLGARLPTGVLLVGPPGTGKTLLAKVIAGEADVPFFFVSGSEFDEMFVGVGASRVRKLFENARIHKPCVLFIDELDAVGGKRNSSPMHPYSRMTLNQLLVELDGYKELEGVMVIGATNFPEALDDALTRPGRFDTRITIPMPDIRARYKILQVHSEKIELDKGVNLELIARATVGFTGADLANLVNQAALRASVDNKNSVKIEDLEFAMDKIRMGRERLSAVINPKDREYVAYHEGGHAIMALFTPGATPIYKATIVPRGPALGMVSQVPEKDVLLISKKEMLAHIDVCMGGRVAEELIFGDENITTGGSSDFEQATNLATSMVTNYGMSDLIGPVTHKLDSSSSDVRKLIDGEVTRILKESYERTRVLLKSHREEHKRLAEALLRYETLNADEIKLVVANKPLNRNL